MTRAQKIIKYAALAFAFLLLLGLLSGIVTVAMMIFGNGGVSDTLSVVSIDGEVVSLDISLDATALTMREGDAFQIETNNSYLTFENKDGTLKVGEKYRYRIFGDKNEARLVLTVPRGKIFNSVEISTGAGVVQIAALLADKVEFDFGAGEVKIDALYVTDSVDIDGGAGRLEIGDGLIASLLDLDMGVGELVFRATLYGAGEINCGVGSATITLLGVEDDYSVQISKGLGDVTVNGTTMHDGETYGNGKSKLHISGGIGEICVSIEEE